ncbi:MAG: rod shape-determining protein, partial [Oscillospiraceae bacterium]
MGSLDIGIDLGTTKIIIYKEGVGEILREPSVVTVNTRDDSVVAVGTEALRMLGRTPGYIKVSFPLSGGVISDHVLTEILVKDCLQRASNNFLIKHRVIICIPSSITDVEKRTLVEVVVNAGGRKV